MALICYSMDTPHPLIPLSCCPCNSKLTVSNPFCSFQWHVCREEKLTNLFSLNFESEQPPTADNCSFSMTCPVISILLLFLRILPGLSDTRQPTSSLLVMRILESLGIDGHRNFGNMFSLLERQDYHSSMKVEDKDSFIKGLYFSLNEFYALRKFSRI